MDPGNTDESVPAVGFTFRLQLKGAEEETAGSTRVSNTTRAISVHARHSPANTDTC